MSAPLVFKTLSMTNFAGYYGQQSVRFPEGIRNVMPVKGRNTSGKTSFINAIKWCLYGQVSSRTSDRLTLLELFNSAALREGREEMSVSMDLVIQGKPYTLTRTAKRKTTRYSPTSDNDFDVAVYLRDGQDIRTESEASHLINKVAPFAISRFFLFDGELLREYETLIKSRKNKAGSEVLIDAIEDVLGIPAMANASKIIREATRAATADMERVLQKQSSNTAKTRQLEQYNAQRNNLAQEALREEERVQVLRDREAKLKALVEEDRHHLSKSDRFKDIQEGLARAQKTIEEQRQRLASLGSSAWRDLLSAAIERHQESLATQVEVVKQNYNKDIINSYATDQLEGLLKNSACSTCGQHLTREGAERIQRELNLLTQEHAARLLRMQQADHLIGIQQQLMNLQRQIRPISDAYREAKRSLEESLNEQIRLDVQQEQLAADLENFDGQNARQNRNDFDEVSLEIRQLKKSIQDKMTMIDTLDQNIAQHIKGIDSAGATTELENMKRVNATLSQLYTLFDESRDVLRGRMRGHIQDIASKAYRKMIHEEDHQGIEISSTNYSMEIIDTHGNPVVEPSAGATQIMALALIIALGRAGRPIGPIVMDTPFGRLDEDHRQRVMHHLPNYANQLVLLYHSGELQNASLRQIADRVGITYEIDKHGESQSVINEAL